MNKYSIAAAVGSILASAVASAAGPHDLYIGGASAQSAFFKADFTTQVCGNSAGLVTTYTVTGATVANEAWRCTATGSTIAGITNGDIVTVHYNSELGTISAVAPLVYNTNIARRLFVNPDSPNCQTAGATRTCLVTSYDNKTETHVSPNGNSTLVARPFVTGAAFNQFDIGVLDTQAKFWAQEQNWTDTTFATAMGAQPSLATLNALSGATVMNGQVFSVLAHNAGPLAAGGTISSRSLEAIYTGQYDVWGDVPEVGGGNTVPIKLCRREFGSGTGVAASIFLTGRECGIAGSRKVATINSTPPNPGFGELTLIEENTSTGAVRTCVAGNVGAIGVTSLSTNTAYITLNLDGVEPNAHNAATGLYPFAFETIVYNRSVAAGATAPVQALANSMITNAQKITGLTGGQTEVAAKTTTATAGLAGNQFTVVSPNSRRVAYAVPGPGFGNTVSRANATTNTAAVNALVYLAGDACKKAFNTNDE